LAKSRLEFSWLTGGDFFESLRLDKSNRDMGFGWRYNSDLIAQDFNFFQEDGRLLVLHDNRLLVSYSVMKGIRFRGGCFHPCYFYAHYNNITRAIEFSPSVIIAYEDPINLSLGQSNDQKNWIPFEFRRDVYFIQSLEPFHIVQVSQIESYRASVRTIVNDSSILPWSKDYGWPLRGSTPAIRIHYKNEVFYLTFFHTISRVVVPMNKNVKLRTYWFGGLTFCPNLPFQIHSVSKYPIVMPFLYNSTWAYRSAWKLIDYVVFPIGLIIDPQNASNILMSLGSQDRNGFIVKMNVEKLLDSMTLVRSCL
jgi:hypothetical protein